MATTINHLCWTMHKTKTRQRKQDSFILSVCCYLFSACLNIVLFLVQMIVVSTTRTQKYNRQMVAVIGTFSRVLFGLLFLLLSTILLNWIELNLIVVLNIWNSCESFDSTGRQCWSSPSTLKHVSKVTHWRLAHKSFTLRSSAGGLLSLIWSLSSY